MRIHEEKWPGRKFALCLLLLASGVLLVGCGSTPSKSGSGGYYQDDGPEKNPPKNLMAVPDAVPKVEPYLPGSNRPYAVFGKTYTPITDNRPFKQRGVGSWYGKKFHAQKTSSGERYDMYKMTAAHPTLPIPSYARVTNLANGRKVIVRINDRGPFHAGRIIDLSYVAALKLGYIGAGSSVLEVERLLPSDFAHLNNERNEQSESQAGSAAAAASGRYFVQLGAYSEAEHAQSARSQLQHQFAGNLPSIDVIGNGGVYRVYCGPFTDREKAEAAAEKIEASAAVKPLVVQR